MNKLFYDIHFHAMDLSHANITAFIGRFIDENNDVISKQSIKNFLKQNIGFWKKLVLPFVSFNLLSKKLEKSLKETINSQETKNKLNNIRNLLSFMESSILYDFLIVDYFLKNINPIINQNNTFKINSDLEFNKIVLCPLIMDFGYKNIDNPEIFYNIPPQKPITSQIKDLFAAIKTYYDNDITIRSGNRDKFSIKPTNINKDNKLFEIYPFMGINTKNYNYVEIENMLDKYFNDFLKHDTATTRRQKLYNKMGSFTGNFDNPNACKNVFAGIKLYPPLGFEPWPENPVELSKVKLLYDFCTQKRIPIITHCSTGGFVTDKNAQKYTNPGENQWNNVLKHFPELTINFAHFGSGSQKWQNSIINHIKNNNLPNIYTDFSCNTQNDAYYKNLNTLLKNNPIGKNVLFGSDFMINLIWMKSYNEYLKYFIDTQHLSSDVKHDLVNKNSETFIFGKMQ